MVKMKSRVAMQRCFDSFVRIQMSENKIKVSIALRGLDLDHLFDVV